jgi:threonine dehydrogenase-like Zn-dependent dehydrogenase
MNTLICQEPKKLVWKEREIPIPGESEALIKIKSVGICGTDIHAWGGNQPFFSYPRVLGHEICGEIVGLGKNIQNLKNGQQVAVIPYVACQQCPACLSGRTNCCEKISVIGVHQDGGFSEYLSVPVTNLLDAQGIDPQAAALIEPYAISAHAVRRAAVAPGEQVLVVGAGPIGLGQQRLPKPMAHRWWSPIPVRRAETMWFPAWDFRLSTHPLKILMRSCALSLAVRWRKR